MNLWWVCVVVGILLVGLEVFVPGLVVLWFGFAAIATAIPVALGAPFWVDILTFGGTLLVLTRLSPAISEKLVARGSPGRKTNAGALIGLAGVAVEKLDTACGSGLVRLGAETWSAISESGEPIERGCAVRVVALRGAKVVVRKEGTQ